MSDKECNTMLRERIEELDAEIATERRLPDIFQNTDYINILQKSRAEYQAEIDTPSET